jgi:hypothetical protein
MSDAEPHARFRAAASGAAASSTAPGGGLTDAGIAALARLPALRSLRIPGMRGVTRDVIRVFGAGVRVASAP